MLPIELSRKIKEKSRELGFLLCGICNTDPFIDEGEKLKVWIDKGYNAGMKWFERTIDKRISPSLVLPNAKSVVMVALNYYNHIEYTKNKSFGKISKYALGKDYHEVMNQKLSLFSEYIQSITENVSGIYYSDTGPVMERELAQRAGLGWIGKNANLINREHGSFFFLGCILIDIELYYDKPETNHCGSCSRCIDSCPTKAIIEPNIIDANKCISYLTIEYKGDEFSKELKGKFDNWIFGCDACQDVCPWNKFSIQTNETAFEPLVEPNVEIEEWKNITEEEFKIKFKDSPIKRAKHKGLMRNIKWIFE